MSEEVRREPTGMTASGVSYADHLNRYGIFVFAVLLIVVGGLTSPVFLTSKNLQNIFTEAAPLGIVVIGQCLVILVRGLDLSVASVMATAAVIATEFNAVSNAMIPVIFLVCIAFSALVGLVNGLLVTKRQVSPFLATLATMIVLQGIRFSTTKGAPSGSLPEGFRFLGTGQILGIPTGIVALLILAAFFCYLLHKTGFGRRVYLVGNNPAASNLVGISSDRVTISCYVLSSVCACIGGLFLVGYVGSIDNFVGQGYELLSIVAAVMGGVALTGGRGSILGGLAGALILTVIFNLVLLNGLPSEFQYIIQGVIIIAATAFYMLRRTN
ncbi:MAG: ABC transporter permease [Kiloniellales bacterium]